MSRPRAHHAGVLVAGLTACISGVSVWVNSYGVRSAPDAGVYTTAKNLVAAAVILGALAVRSSIGTPRPAPVQRSRGGTLARWAGLAYVAAIGGGLAFVLYFSGLARAGAEPGAFLHDTLVVWVGLLAWPLLRERPSIWNGAAIALLLVGQTIAVGGVGGLVAGGGEVLVLAATVCWAVEVVVAKRLLSSIAPASLALVRMGGGAVVLVIYLAARGQIEALVRLSGAQVGWALLTGVLLAAYVGTWLLALSRARAIDVTSVLAGSVVVTAALAGLSGHVPAAPETVGLGLVVLGAGIILRAWPKRVAVQAAAGG